MNRYEVVDYRAKHYDLAMIWNGHSTIDSAPHIDLSRNGLFRVVNHRCLDISKSNVDRLHQRLFGYGMSVEPQRYSGLIVVKPDDNCAGSGRVIEGPIDEIEEGFVYHRFVDTVDEAGQKHEYRVSIVGARAVLVRLRVSRFDRDNLKMMAETKAVVGPSEVFGAKECALLGNIAEEIGLDVGDLDVMRDKDGKLYVIDVNKTPSGPTLNSVGDVALVCSTLADDFDTWAFRA